MAPMSDIDDDMLEKKFNAACNAAISPDEWMFVPDGDTDFEKGIRRGLELVLLTIRDQCDGFDLWRENDGSYRLSLSIYESLRYAQDFAKVIQTEVEMNQGDDDTIRAFSAYLRAQADEVDKAIGFRWALEEEPHD
jgi:hypothetical protein